MGALGDILGMLAKPLILAALLLVGLGLMSDNPTRNAGATGCIEIFDDPAWNRTLCQYSPAKLWNMPVADLVPWMSARTDAPE